MGGLGQRLGRGAAHLLRRTYANSAPSCGPCLQPVELILVMSVQRRGRLRLSEISQEAGIPASTMTAIVDRLERANLVRRVGDRRDALIEATPTAAALADAVEASLTRHLEVGGSAPSPEFASRVTRDLERIIRVLGESPPTASAGAGDQVAGTEQAPMRLEGPFEPRVRGASDTAAQGL